MSPSIQKLGRRSVAAVSGVALALGSALLASSPATLLADQSTTVTRAIWQDRETKTLNWGELTRQGDKFSFQKQGSVVDFPELDVERHELVQMEQIDDVLVVGIRDNDRGKFLSGWAAVNVGVQDQADGTSVYTAAPKVFASVVDQEQGNPAHLYIYDRQFYVANDSLNGFTRLSPEGLKGDDAEARKGTFHRGGGGHITMAAVDNKISYSTWIRGTGTVDVSDLSKTGEESIAYTFDLPSGGLHGAIANSGKVFFAPSDGVYWVAADMELKETPETVKFHHLSLGKHPLTERPNRTGAFINHNNWVLFTTGGRTEDAALCLVNAAADQPEVVKLPVVPETGLSLVTPSSFVTAQGKHYGFIFQDGKPAEGQSEKLTVVDLDPNLDGDLSDATVVKHLDVGTSRVDGHYGHHTIGFDATGNWALLTNPGDGTFSLLSLADLEIIDHFEVGGMPTKINVMGGQSQK